MSFVSWFLILYFVNDLFSYNFPKQHTHIKDIISGYMNELFIMVEPYTITTMINLLYCYSVMEIKFNKLKKYANPYILQGKNIISNYIKSHNDGNYASWDIKTTINMYDVQQNFIKVQEYLSKNPLNEHSHFSTDDCIFNFDEHYYYVVSSLVEDSLVTNKIVLGFGSNVIDNKIRNKCSNIHFISLSVNVDDLIEPIEIRLKTNEYNYYMVSNNIDKYFIYYYLKYHTYCISDCLCFDDFKYTLEVMDNNVNMFTITEKDSIYIDKDIYIVNIFKDKPQLIQEEVVKDIIEDIVNTIDTDSNRKKTESFGEPDYIKL